MSIAFMHVTTVVSERL